ncbi:superoxide dismutase family protein [Paenibacillus xerothermodurans]|nr:superoxide dismutase family protein [Paenibacillus xerothermodurans]
MKIVNRAAVVFSVMLLLSACEWSAEPATGTHQVGDSGIEHTQHGSSPTAEEAANDTVTDMKRIDIIDSQGTKVGRAALTETVEGVKLQVEVSGLPPGKHGLHFHSVGACVAPDFKTAGAHFNPETKKHGFDNPEGHHAGDLPNLEIGSDGGGKAEFINKKVTLARDKANSLVKPGGTSLVIHTGPDDYKTDPTGESGGRIACGVIK